MPSAPKDRTGAGAKPGLWCDSPVHASRQQAHLGTAVMAEKPRVHQDKGLTYRAGAVGFALDIESRFLVTYTTRPAARSLGSRTSGAVDHTLCKSP